MAKEHRPDIDGLRAIAVTGVLGFHAFPATFRGGFTGVDVFFVISGFLISGIILDELRDGSFTFTAFYARRIRRIFPALALILSATILFGWWCLTPYDYDELGSQLAAGAAFVANILIWQQSGYFETDAALKPLLHLWSLGVEEQYYILWPLLLFILRRHVTGIFWLIAAIAAASFALNIAIVDRLPEATFYLPVTRFWELMLGSLLAYAHFQGGIHAELRGTGRELASIAGTALLVLAFGLVNEASGFPGWPALLPCIGTVLLIWAGRDAWINKHLLSRPIVIYIGLISYPLYLWHWPILSFAYNIQGGPPPLQIRAGALLLSLCLAWATYELIERPIRRAARNRTARRRAVMVSATSVGALAGLGLLVAGNHVHARSSSVPHLAQISAAYSDWHVHSNGVFPGDTEETVLFFGDSHMQQFLPRIQALIHQNPTGRRTVIFMTRGGCAPIPGIDRPTYECANFVADGFALAHAPHIHTVVISASWIALTQRKDYYRLSDPRREPLKLFLPGTEWVLQGFATELARLVKDGKHVVLVLSSPFGDQFDPHNMAQRDGLSFHVVQPLTSLPRATLSAQTAFIDNPLEEIARRVHATVVRPLDSLCSQTECPVVDPAGEPILMDFSHLRSSFVARYFTAFDDYVLRHPASSLTSAAR